MSGVAVIRYLLANNAPMIAVVPPARIQAGTLPLDTARPAISVVSVSSVRRNTVHMAEPTTVVTERVQVSMLVNESTQGGNGYPALVTGMRLIRQACPNQNGTVNGVALDSILPDTEGPDLAPDEAAIISRSQDFIVRWRESR